MTKYKYTKKNCYTVAKSIIDGINDNNERGVLLSHCDIYLYDYEAKLRWFIHVYGDIPWDIVLKEKEQHNWIEITDWFRDRPMYTKKELANMIYHFYEVF